MRRAAARSGEWVKCFLLVCWSERKQYYSRSGDVHQTSLNGNDAIITLPLRAGGCMPSIVIRMSVCLSVHSHNSKTTHGRTSPICCMLVSWLGPPLTALRYVICTSSFLHFHGMGPRAKIKHDVMFQRNSRLQSFVESIIVRHGGQRLPSTINLLWATCMNSYTHKNNTVWRHYVRASTQHCRRIVGRIQSMPEFVSIL